MFCLGISWSITQYHPPTLRYTLSIRDGELFTTGGWDMLCTHMFHVISIELSLVYSSEYQEVIIKVQSLDDDERRNDEAKRRMSYPPRDSEPEVNVSTS